MIVRGIPRFGPGSAERSNQGKRNNSDGETIDGHSASISRNRPSCKTGVSADPSVFRIRLLYGLLIMGHGRRQIIWFGDGPSPTAEWIANQITETCGWEQIPRYLIRDRDGAYGHVFIRRLRSMGIRDRSTSPRSPWQNGLAERLIGSIRRECLDLRQAPREPRMRSPLSFFQSPLCPYFV